MMSTSHSDIIQFAFGPSFPGRPFGYGGIKNAPTSPLRCATGASSCAGSGTPS